MKIIIIYYELIFSRVEKSRPILNFYLTPFIRHQIFIHNKLMLLIQNVKVFTICICVSNIKISYIDIYMKSKCINYAWYKNHFDARIKHTCFDNLPYVGSTSLLCHFAWVTPCTEKDTHMSIIYDKKLSLIRLNLII